MKRQSRTFATACFTCRLCTLLLFMTVGAASPQYGENPGGRISGTVRDAVTGEPIAEVRVTLLEHYTPPIATFTTDEDGSFLFSGIPRGTYTVCARKLNFVERCWLDRPAFGTEIHITEMEVYKGLDIDLPRAAGVKGFVYDENGDPVAGGYVFFKPLDLKESSSYDMMTGADGQFFIVDLPPATYRISAQRFSKPARHVVGKRWFYPGVADPEESETVILKEGAIEEIEILFSFDQRAVARDATWVAHVIDEDGEPIAGVDVVLRIPEDTTQTPAACRTDEEGECRAEGIPAGEYWASTRLVPAPYAPWRDLERPRGDRGRYAQPVILEDGELTETEFQLSSGLRLEVHFRHADGSPLAEDSLLTVYLKSLEGPGHWLEERPPGDPGVVYFHGLISGESYQVYLRSHQPFARYCPTGLALVGGRLGKMSDRWADGVKIEPEKSPLRLFVTLSALATLHGYSDNEGGVVEAERIGGPPLAPVLYQPGRPLTFSTRVRKGRFLLRGLPPGRYKIWIRREYWIGRKDSIVELELQPGEERSLDLYRSKNPGQR